VGHWLCTPNTAPATQPVRRILLFAQPAGCQTSTWAAASPAICSSVPVQSKTSVYAASHWLPRLARTASHCQPRVPSMLHLQATGSPAQHTCTYQFQAVLRAHCRQLLVGVGLGLAVWLAGLQRVCMLVTVVQLPGICQAGSQSVGRSVPHPCGMSAVPLSWCCQLLPHS
jgi:hypothetical protein